VRALQHPLQALQKPARLVITGGDVGQDGILRRVGNPPVD